MKIRAGFVSNSSSSSFTALFRKKDLAKVLKGLTALEIATVENLITDCFLWGQEFCTYSHISGEAGWYNLDIKKIKARALELAQEGHKLFEDDPDLKTFWDDECEEYVEEYICDAFYNFESKVQKLPVGEKFIHTDSF